MHKSLKERRESARRAYFEKYGNWPADTAVKGLIQAADKAECQAIRNAADAELALRLADEKKVLRFKGRAGCLSSRKIEGIRAEIYAKYRLHALGA